MLELGHTFLQSVERSPDALALVDGDVRLTYFQWHERVARVVQGLADLGLSRSDHVVVILQNRWEMATLHWACQFLGIVVTPLNWRAKAEEIDYCLRDSDAAAVVFGSESADAVSAAQSAADIVRITIDGAVPGARPFDTLLAARPWADPPRAVPESTSVMLYTSGTTGPPKGVPRTHRAERAAALAHVAQNVWRRGERTLGVMPLYHTMGVRALLATALLDGTFVCMRHFHAGDALALIQSERISSLYLVPTLYHDLVHHGSFSPVRVDSVKRIGFAGAPMPDALVQKVRAAFLPEIFVNHYGSSEVYTFTVEPDASRKPGSAGRAGLNARIRIVRLDARSPDDRVAPGEEGQIVADLRGDEAFSGYWNRPDADTKALRSGWYFTGDTGYVDVDGDLFVTGRVDDMILSGGENVSPVEIESVLSLHPAVDEVAVAGLADPRWGQRVVAFVKRRSPVDADALDAHCQASSLMNFKRPREYVFVREIPKSPVGKILRRKLGAGEYDADLPSPDPVPTDPT
ncbi:MAG: AMP-binding protein [Betaproteobacteria bacterium]|nr:AMP-binding protein [Betaproteobacteria bacterium]